MAEIRMNRPEGRRSIDAIARVNFLHDRWREAGKISNDNLLYTLGLFALEPVHWTAKFEWRDLTMLEKNAITTFWRDVGQDMDISYQALTRYMTRKSDAMTWLDALHTWSVQYQEDCMAYAASNKKLARANVHLLLLDLPKWSYRFAFAQLRCFMNPLLRHALGYVPCETRLFPQPGPASADSCSI